MAFYFVFIGLSPPQAAGDKWTCREVFTKERCRVPLSLRGDEALLLVRE